MNDRTAELQVDCDSRNPELARAHVDDRLRRVTGRRTATRAGLQPRINVIVLAVPLGTDQQVADLGASREMHWNGEIPRTERPRLRFSGWELDLMERRLVAPGGGVVRLPGLEFALLRAFVDHPRRVMSRADLANLTQREDRTFHSARTVDVYVSRLRRRLGRSGGAPLISTVWRAGYAFDTDVAWS